MTAFVLSEVKILDPESVAQYKQEAPASIAKYGGSYLARDAIPFAFEGQFDPAERIVLISFPTEEAARTWYTFPGNIKRLSIRPTVACNGGCSCSLDSTPCEAGLLRCAS